VVGDLAPLGASGIGIILCEGGTDERRDDTPALLTVLNGMQN
jgi:hypothetical protein